MTADREIHTLLQTGSSPETSPKESHERIRSSKFASPAGTADCFTSFPLAVPEQHRHVILFPTDQNSSTDGPRATKVPHPTHRIMN